MVIADIRDIFSSKSSCNTRQRDNIMSVKDSNVVCRTEEEHLEFGMSYCLRSKEGWKR